MVLVRDFNTIVTQTFTILSDIQTLYGPVCNISTKLVSTTLPFMTLVDTTVTLDESVTTGADVAKYTV